MSDGIDKYRLFIESGCLSQDAMQKYIAKELDSKDMHLVEKHLLDCPFCADALDGFAEVKDKDKISSVLDELKADVGKLTQKEQLIPVVEIGKSRNLYRRYAYIAVAASVLIFSGVYVVFNKYLTNDSDTVVTQKMETQDVREKMNEQDKPKNLPAPALDESVSTLELDGRLSHEQIAKEKLGKSASEGSEGNISSGRGYFTTPELKELDAVEDVIVDLDEEEEAVEVIAYVYTEAQPVLNADKVTDKKEEVVLEPMEIKADDIGVSSVTVKSMALRSKKKDKLISEKAPAELFSSRNSNERKVVTYSAVSGSVKQPLKGSKDISYGLDDGLLEVENNKSIAGGVLIEDAKNEYDTGNYVNAIDKYEQLLEVDSNNVQARYYCALAYLNNNQPGKAANYFNKVLQASDKTYSEEAKWHLATAYINMKELKSAKVLLDDIVTRKGKYKEKARAVLENLE